MAPLDVLLIEDEPRIAELIIAGLSQRGAQVTHCAQGHLGFERAREGGFHALVLDIGLPGRDGLSILRGLRAAGVSTPVILLTARNELEDRVTGLELGADDYLAKPFYVEELYARLQTLLRRAGGDRLPHRLRVGSWWLDRLARTLGCEHQAVELTAREFSLMEHLMRAPGQVRTRQQIIEQVWGYGFDPTTNLIDVCVRRLRGKCAEVAPSAETPSPIESVRGVGYRFLVEP